MKKGRKLSEPVLSAAALLLSGLLWSGSAGAAQIFYESFEAPDITGDGDGTNPTGWSQGGTSAGLSDVDGGQITTPYGAQVAWIWQGNNSLSTQSGHLSVVLSANTTYTLTFNVSSSTSQSDCSYLIELKAGGFVLASTSGTVSSTDMSESGSVTLTTGTAHPQMGQTLVIKIGGSSRRSHFDNIALDASAAPEDNTKPTPDPMEWQTVPFAVDFDSISMTCTTAVDDATQVQYLFTNTVKGTTSGWQWSREWCEVNLSPSTLYSYQVKARDISLNYNETDWSTPALSATTLNAEPFLIFKDSFEDPDITGDSSTDPTGWIPAGHGGAQGVRDESSGTISTIYGAQVAKIYNTATLTTSSSHLTNVVQEKMIYTLSVNVGIVGADYRVELLAGGTALGVISGTATSDDMSQTDEVVVEVEPDNPYIGQPLSVVMRGDGQTPCYDNVRLYAEPFPPAGTLFLLL